MMPEIKVGTQKYRAVIITETGENLDLTPKETPIVSELSWEEARQELAARATFSFPNIRVERVRLVNKIKMGQKVFIYSDWGQGMTEVFRGTIFRRGLEDDENGSIELTVYDNSFYLQRSRDQLYVANWTSCRAAITRLLDRWKVPYAYNGPSTILAKGRLFKGDTVAEIILTLLDEARQKGGGEHVAKDVQGKIIIEPIGHNQTVWVLTRAALGHVMDDQSIEDLVTRVKILSDLGNDRESPVAAVVDGKTEFGILQEIINHDTDESLAEARQAAQTILKDRGAPIRTISFEAPDVPPLRKGDLAHIDIGERKVEVIVESVQHNALQKKMSLEVHPKL